MANDSLSIMVQPRDGGWITLGTGHRFQVVPESIKFNADSSQFGCLNATWTMNIDPHFDHYDLEHFTPVVIMDGSMPIWSGFIISTPTVFGDSGYIEIEAQGWGQHLKHRAVDKKWLVSDMSKWVDLKQSAAVPLNSGTYKYDQRGQVSQGQGVLTLGIPAVNGANYVANTAVGIFFDAGPNNLIETVTATYESSNNTAAITTFCNLGSTPGCGFDGAAVANYETHWNFVNNAGATGSKGAGVRASTDRRYAAIVMLYAAGGANAADVWSRLLSLNVFTNGTRDESGGVSILKASDIIGDVLSLACPKISTDLSKITATTFAIPEFYT